MDQKLQQKVLERLKANGKRGWVFIELADALKTDKLTLRPLIEAMKRQGLVVEKKRKLYPPEALSLLPATVSRLNKTYGFARLNDTEQEIFLPGGRMMGAMVGDTVLLRLMKGRTGDLDEGEVYAVVNEADIVFSGLYQPTRNGAYILPDELGKTPLRLCGDLYRLRDGDKITARIIYRGESHREHEAELVCSYGALTAASCARAVLDVHGITESFPESVRLEAKHLEKKGISEKELAGRLDLRDQVIFTIDGADTKDIDDAISLSKTADGWKLGVHIADVSHYVKPNTALDEEAFRRGTSIYYADAVIPMLPKELSNGICSLNEGEDRLAFSALLTLTADGKLSHYEFKKTVIRSRIKGVYSEVNALLAGEASEAVVKKYRAVTDTLKCMNELCDILIENRIRRGAPEIESSESKLILDEAGHVREILPRTRGKAEVMIEEFMLLANEAAATLAKTQELPFVYRVHEMPNAEKIAALRELLQALGIPTHTLKDNPPAGALAEILRSVKGSSAASVVGYQVLRSMAKAKYSENPLGHYGLVLENYAHFTSPIRRYPDLAIHRILSDVVSGRCKQETLVKKYRTFSKRAASGSTEAELTATQIERKCEDCYKAEYMHDRLGDVFSGVISSVTSFGFYVTLQNTVEGLVRAEALTDGDYRFDGLMEYRDANSDKRYRLGDAIEVCCVSADINEGHIDLYPTDQPQVIARPPRTSHRTEKKPTPKRPERHRREKKKRRRR